MKAVAIWLGSALVAAGASMAGPEARLGLAPTESDPYDDSHWSDQCHLDGVNHIASDVAVYDGALVVAGAFGWAGPERAPALARWDGARWHAIGPITSGIATVLTPFGSSLVAGGTFDLPPNSESATVVVWNGSQLEPLGDLVEAPEALVVHNGELLAGGSFRPGPVGTPHYLVAKWNGSKWDYFGEAESGSIYEMHPWNEALVATGYFTEIDGVSLSNIATWDGAQWSALGAGLSNPGLSLATFQSDLVVGGSFFYAGAETVNFVARWDGSSWHALGAGLGDPPWVSYVLALHGREDELFVGGNFKTVPGGGANAARWDGSSWHSLTGGSPSGSVRGFTEYSGDLALVGGFGAVGSTPAQHVATWNELGWSTLGPGLGYAGYVYDLASHQGDLYVCGLSVARLEGSSWRQLTADSWPSPKKVHSLVSWNDVLVGGGGMLTSEGAPGDHVVQWDGQEWSGVGDGINGTVSSLHVYQDEVIAAGSFTEASGSIVDGIARWDGTAWHPLGPGVFGESGVGGVHDMTVYQDELIIVGDFIRPNGGIGNRVAAWDGGIWHELDIGLNGTARAAAVFSDDLYVGGDFSLAGGEPADRIARWDGARWTEVTPGLASVGSSHRIEAMAVYNDGLVVWTRISAENEVFRWDGSSWIALGSGFSVGSYFWARAMEPHAESLWFGGTFRWVAGRPSVNLARWTDTDLGTAIAELPGLHPQLPGIMATPNPFRTVTDLRFNLPASTHVRLNIYDVSGRLVRRLVDGELAGGEHRYNWNGRSADGDRVAGGVYFGRLQVGDVDTSRRLVVVR